MLRTKKDYGDRITPDQAKALDEFYEGLARIFAEQIIWMRDEEGRKLQEVAASGPSTPDLGEGL